MNFSQHNAKCMCMNPTYLMKLGSLGFSGSYVRASQFLKPLEWNPTCMYTILAYADGKN